ncbi:NADPH-dependent FMN reductase [Novosphingobium sp.]|uniref:NADPH-dependent FMN reductase n=1 Tax=Novosphingobium sp. TaxID=1874826 RepID=UPI0028A89309|nr:NADPH-dependent FMN reductase [Novosphingobium sp.]
MAGKKIVGLGGTGRQASSSEKIVRAVLSQCEDMGASTTMFDGPFLLSLPHFNPEDPQRDPAQAALVDAVRHADGIVIGTPGYHGGYSGLVKNAVDLLEDLRSDTNVYLDGRPVGLVVTAAGWQACGTTLSSLRDVVHALRGWPTPVGIAVNSMEQRVFAEDGSVADGAVQRAIQAQAEQIMRFRIETVA